VKSNRFFNLSNIFNNAFAIFTIYRKLIVSKSRHFVPLDLKYQFIKTKRKGE